MSDKPSHDDPQDIATKFPGLAQQQPVKSITVQRPVDRDEKTVIETHLHEADQPTHRSVGKTKKSSQKLQRHLDDNPHDEVPESTVLELPPSPEQRKARRRKRLWITLAITVIVLTGGWALLYFSPLLAVEDITHEGLELVAESDAQEQTTQLLGTPLPQVTDNTATELFASNPAVDEVTVRAEPPHGLVVVVHEHTPVAMSPRGKQYVVFSDQGNELAEIPSQRAQEFDLPVVASASDVADQEVFDTITEVLGSLPDELRDQVRAASGASIDSIELEMSSGKTVMWGNTEHADQKIGVLQALLNLDEDQAAEISEYDVSAPDFPVTR